MKKLTTLSLTIALIFLVQHICPGQISLPIGGIKIASKEEKRAKQLESSPARGEIQFVEGHIRSLQSSFKSGDWEKRGYGMKEKKDYEETELEIKKIEDAIAEIKNKDSKWAEKNDYSADVADVKNSFNSKKEAFKEVLKKEDDRKFFETKYRELQNLLGDKYYGLYDYAKFSKYASDFHHAETKKKIDDLVAENPDFKKDYYYERLNPFFETHFPEFADKKLMPELEKMKTEAAEGFERGPSSSKKKITEAIGYCKIMSELAPDKTQYKQMIPQLEELLVKFDKFLDEKIYTSAFHKKHVGQTLFSNKPIIAGKEKEEDFKTSFKAGEPVFAISYFGVSAPAYVDFSFYINTNKYATGSFMDRALYSTDKLPTVTVYTYMVIPDPAYLKTKTVKGAGAYSAFLIMDNIMEVVKAKGEFADKKLNMELRTGNTHTFTLDASENFAAMQQAYDAVKKQRIDDLRLPKSAGANAEISAAFNAALSEFGQVQKISLSDAAWTYRKNKYTSIIVSREAYGYAVVKDKTGKCYMYGVTVEQQKGGAAYGKAEIKKIYEDFENIDGNQYTEDLDGKKEADAYKHGFEFNCANINK